MDVCVYAMQIFFRSWHIYRHSIALHIIHIYLFQTQKKAYGISIKIPTIFTYSKHNNGYYHGAVPRIA